MEVNSIDTPVLLIAFNRPDVTEVSFNKIREAKPKKLYVTIDGFRDSKPGEDLLCKQVLEITKNVDWDCDAKYLVRETNEGCRNNVVKGLNWVFENEDRVIIIEDDIVPTLAFLHFAEEMLEKYKNDDRIAMVSANNYTPLPMDVDYFFSQYGHISGWATWKRVWEKFDVNVPQLKDEIDNDFPHFKFYNQQEKKHFRKYYTIWQARIMDGTSNAWGPPFAFFRKYNNLLSIIPKVNLTTNIGNFSSRVEGALKKTKKYEAYFPSDESFKVVVHPNEIVLNDKYEKHHFKKHIKGKSFFHIIIHKGLRIFNLK